MQTGVFYESLNLASCMKLPIIFICEDNNYSVYSPKEVRQPMGRKIEETASALGIKTNVMEGTNVEEIYNNMNLICDEVRSKIKPYFVLLKTCRYKEHCGPGEDDYLNYRSLEEINYWKANDPIIRLKKKINSIKVSEIEKEIRNEIKDSFLYAKESDFPNEKEASNNIFS